MSQEDNLRRELVSLLTRYNDCNIRVNSFEAEWLSVGTMEHPLRAKLLNLHLSITSLNIGDSDE